MELLNSYLTRCIERCVILCLFFMFTIPVIGKERIVKPELRADYERGFSDGVFHAANAGDSGGILDFFPQTESEKAYADGFNDGRYLVGDKIDTSNNWHDKSCDDRAKIILEILSKSPDVPSFISAKKIVKRIHSQTEEELKVIAELEKIGSAVIQPHCGQIDTVRFRGKKFGNGELVLLEKLPNLKALVVENTSVTNEGLKQLEKLGDLRVLMLKKGHFTDSGIVYIAKLKKLEGLILNDIPITDEALQHLQELKSLKSLMVGGTKVTTQGAKKLKKTLPNCEITWEQVAID